jgi:hypothetical protein
MSLSKLTPTEIKKILCDFGCTCALHARKQCKKLHLRTTKCKTGNIHPACIGLEFCKHYVLSKCTQPPEQCPFPHEDPSEEILTKIIDIMAEHGITASDAERDSSGNAAAAPDANFGPNGGAAAASDAKPVFVDEAEVSAKKPPVKCRFGQNCWHKNSTCKKDHGPDNPSAAQANENPKQRQSMRDRLTSAASRDNSANRSRSNSRNRFKHLSELQEIKDSTIGECRTQLSKDLQTLFDELQPVVQLYCSRQPKFRQAQFLNADDNQRVIHMAEAHELLYDVSQLTN